MEQRTSKEVIESYLNLENAEVADVGCGDGSLARMMTRRGAHVTGIEVSPRQLSKARSSKTAGTETYMQGVAEDLPLKNRSTDIVVFFNSFHHIDQAGHFTALKEAARVLKSGGILFVSEPLAQGPYFELMKPAHDETEARRAALESLRHAPEVGLLQEHVLSHLDTVKFPDFEAFHDRITQINPETRERFDQHMDEIRASFDRLGTPEEDGQAFLQPMRVHVFRRT